jgi:hypothetical protein
MIHTLKERETELWKFGDGFNPVWVAFGAHLNFDDLVSRHSKEYSEETAKTITGIAWQYARREFDEDSEDGSQRYYLYKKRVNGATTPVTVIL